MPLGLLKGIDVELLVVVEAIPDTVLEWRKRWLEALPSGTRAGHSALGCQSSGMRLQWD